MATFHETVCICVIHLLFNQITNQYAYNLGQLQLRRKSVQNEALLNRQLINYHDNRVKQQDAALVNHPDNKPSIQQYNDNPILNHLINQAQAPLHNNYETLQSQHDPLQNEINPNNLIISNQHPQHAPIHQKIGKMSQLDQKQFINIQPQNPLKIDDAIRIHPSKNFNPQNQRFNYKIDQLSNPAKYNIHPKSNEKEPNNRPQRLKKIDPIRMQRGGFGGNRQTFKHFRYSRIRRYYTLSTASMTTWKKLNYTTRLMYTTPTTRTTRRYTDPYIQAGPSRQTVLHTRMTESDEIGREIRMSESLEYKDDSFDKPPTSMVAYDSLVGDTARNTTANVTVVQSTVTTVTKPITVPKTTKKISSELISLESSSEEKPSSSEAKDEVSSSESEDYGNEKLYGEYGYHRKYNNTPNPYTIVTYANIREVPGFDECNLTSAEVAFWEANASFVMDNFFPSLELISNYSEENLVRSFFHNENIEPHHLDFYKWYYKLLINPDRLRTIYNRTVLEEPDYKNLSQFTPYPIPDDLQRYYMFICQMENEINREKQQEEHAIKTQREAEQNLDRLLGDGTGGGGRPAGGTYRAPRITKSKGDPDVSQILQMIDHPQDSMMPGGGDSSEGFIDASRYKREVSKFEPD